MAKAGFVVVGAIVGWLAATLSNGAGSAGFPVKYEICDNLGRDCWVNAHFKDFDGCEFYKKFMMANCDSTKPGRIDCVTGLPSTAQGHCTR